MLDLKTAARKSVWFFLYFAAFFPMGFAFYYASEKNLLLMFVASTISLLIYTLLIIKNLKFWSSLAFFTLILTVLSISGTGVEDLLNANDEKIFLTLIPLQLSFVIIGSIFWVRKESSILKKLIALIPISISIALLVAFGTNPPDYYQNFIYGRITFLPLAAFSIFLLTRKKWILGTLGLILVVGGLYSGATLFQRKAYTLGEAEEAMVLTATTPIAKEMLGYYNRKDFTNFCNRCSYSLLERLEESSLEPYRDYYGPYTSLGTPTTVIWQGGYHYVKYPIRFQKKEKQMYIIFQMGGIPASPSVEGFSFFEE